MEEWRRVANAKVPRKEEVCVAGVQWAGGCGGDGGGRTQAGFDSFNEGSGFYS